MDENTNHFRNHWRKQIRLAFKDRHRFHSVYGRLWVRKCIWNYWSFGGLGGNPMNAKKYFPKADNSWVDGE